MLSQSSGVWQRRPTAFVGLTGPHPWKICSLCRGQIRSPQGAPCSPPKMPRVGRASPSVWSAAGDLRLQGHRHLGPRLRAHGLGRRHAAPPPLAPLKPPQAPGPRVPPRQHETSAGGAEPRPPRPCCHSRPASWPASQQKVAAARLQAWASAGCIPRRHPQRAAPAPRALLPAPEHREHRHREARPPARLLAARAHHRHLHRCNAMQGRERMGSAGSRAPSRVCCAGRGRAPACFAYLP